MNIAQALSKTFLFKDFPKAELERLSEVAKYEQRTSENMLFREGDKGDTLFVLVMGTVAVMKRNADGVDQEVAQLGTGSYFGEMAVVDEAHERSATILTKEPSELITFKQTDVLKLFERDDKIAHHFYRALCRGLTRRLRATTQDAAFFKAMAKQRHNEKS